MSSGAPPLFFAEFSDCLLQVTHVDVFQRVRRRAFRLLGINLHGKLKSFGAYLGVGMPDPVRRIVFPTLTREIRLERNLLGEKFDGRLFVRIEPAMGADKALHPRGFPDCANGAQNPESTKLNDRRFVAGVAGLISGKQIPRLDPFPRPFKDFSRVGLKYQPLAWAESSDVDHPMISLR
jgi:hypothetical protein